ncbi:MAG: hypothetical protein ACHQ15_06940 [Candidatus Limnocylindrales bacterium]
MADPFAFWVFLALLSGTVAIIWLLTGRVLRQEDDLAADERAAEAAWIAAAIEAGGGDVPATVVEQVLDLHRHYLEGGASARDDAAMDDRDAGRQAPEADLGKAP